MKVNDNGVREKSLVVRLDYPFAYMQISHHRKLVINNYASQICDIMKIEEDY